MGYLITGNLSGSLPRSFFEFLGNVTVRMYLPEKENGDTKRNDNETQDDMVVLDEKEIALKKKLLLGEGITDADGYYSIMLADSYNRGPISICVEVTEVPYQKQKKDKSIHCFLKTLQPFWRKQSEYHHFSFNYRFAYEFWSGLRAQFDAWMIFGHIKPAMGVSKAEGLTVTAYDVDWITDDLLGTTRTDASGYFRIDYTSTDFKKTFLSPLVNVETPLTALQGPGVYFKITSDKGEILYAEHSAIGKTAERKNVPHCFYVELTMVPKRSI